jgi:tripartite-type tricarboxylate transporter receptor subunit TctC
VVPLAVTTTKRAKELPNVPTIAESGYPGFDAPAWWAMISPARTSPEIIQEMNKAVNRVLKTKAVKDKLEAQGIEIAGGDPAALQAFIAKQIGVWGKFVIQNQIKE